MAKRVDLSGIEQMYLQDYLSINKIAKIKNCGTTTVLNYLRKKSIKMRTMRDAWSPESRATKSRMMTGKHRLRINWSDLKTLYVDNELSKYKIAEIKGCSPPTVLNMLREQGIPVRKTMPPKSRERLSAHMKRNNPMLGKHHSEELRKKWSLERRGEKHPMWGKHLSEEIKNKIKMTCIERKVSVGELNPNFNGWLSKKPYSLTWDEILKAGIRTRDNHFCMVCNKSESSFREKLHIHHIDYDKLNCELTNLVSLCRKCHLLTNYNRTEWTAFFRLLLNEKYDYNYEVIKNEIIQE
jgi:hypothetical protein